MSEDQTTHQQGRAHARLSGSVASIFTKCTGAPALWAGRTRQGTHFTREGTAAHEIAEHVYKHGTGNVPSVMKVEGHDVPVTDEMAFHVGMYVGQVAKLAREADWHAVEQRFEMDALWEMFGDTIPEPMFGSADYVGIKGDNLTVMDLKFGKGIPVIAEDNAQLLYYGLGAYLWVLKNNPPGVQINKLRTITLIIAQPRVRDELSTWTIDIIDLIHWGTDVLKRAVDDITAGQTRLVAGTHCQFCLGKAVCPELAAQSMQAAKSVFGSAPPVDAGAARLATMIKPAVDLTDDELSDAYARAEILSIWMNGVRAELETRVKNGRPFKDWKLVEKRANRQWIDDPNIDVPGVIAQRAGMSRFDFMTNPELHSPAQVEKIAKSKGLDPKKLLKDIVVAPVTGTTVVPASDARPAVPAGAANVFPVYPGD